MMIILRQRQFFFVYLLFHMSIVIAASLPTPTSRETKSIEYGSMRSGNSLSPSTEGLSAEESKSTFFTKPLAVDEYDTPKKFENKTVSTAKNTSHEISSSDRQSNEKDISEETQEETIRAGSSQENAGSSQESAATDRSGSSGSRKGHGPFAIQVEDQKYYGGLITYIHHLHPARICRVLNACIRHDGTLVLPKWMQRHDNLLNFNCGQKQLEFSAENTNPPASMTELDLVGLSLPQPSIPDFVRDFMPNAVVFDLIYGDRDVRTSCHSRKGNSCESFPSLLGGLNTAIFLPPRLEALEQKQSWVREFITLMKPPNSGRQAKVLYNYPDAKEGSGMQCFRSAFFTRGPFSKYHIMSDHLQEMSFLKSHGINKTARRFQQTQKDGSAEPVSCHLNITISNRKLSDDISDQLVGRYITNIPSIRAQIVKQADRVPGLNVHVATITLEGKSLWWQINAMQKTDIWVAGHGPLLTNMLFMRQNSTVIEIQPFTYYPQLYEKIAQHVAHVNYERYIANPDEEAFEKCINQIYQPGHNSYNEVRTLHDRYLRASKKFFQSDSTHSLVLHTLEGRGLDYVRACARMQRLTTNARNFAVAIVRQARIRCGLPPPQAQENED